MSEVQAEDPIPEDPMRNKDLTFVELVIKISSTLLLIITFPISFWFCLKTIKSNQSAIRCQLGKDQKILGPGLVVLNPLIETLDMYDTRITQVMTEPQKALTANFDAVQVESQIFYRIVDPLRVKNTSDDLLNCLKRHTFGCIDKSVRKVETENIFRDRQAMEDEVLECLEVTSQLIGIEIDRLDLFLFPLFEIEIAEDELMETSPEENVEGPPDGGMFN